jgi:(2Fe-2S) ferredoxin
MSKDKPAQRSRFAITGKLLGLTSTDGQTVKYLEMATPVGVYWIKLSKRLQCQVKVNQLQEQEWIHLIGVSKLNPKTGQMKLKAHTLTPATPSHLQQHLTFSVAQPKEKPEGKILVCQKSSCCQRGAQAICAALKTELGDRGLDKHVEIVKTGCMNNCKAGPHVVIMPGKARYTKVKTTQVAQLIDQHFSPPQASPVTAKFSLSVS